MHKKTILYTHVEKALVQLYSLNLEQTRKNKPSWLWQLITIRERLVNYLEIFSPLFSSPDCQACDGVIWYQLLIWYKCVYWVWLAHVLLFCVTAPPPWSPPPNIQYPCQCQHKGGGGALLNDIWCLRFITARPELRRLLSCHGQSFWREASTDLPQFLVYKVSVVILQENLLPPPYNRQFGQRIIGADLIP